MSDYSLTVILVSIDTNSLAKSPNDSASLSGSTSLGAAPAVVGDAIVPMRGLADNLRG